MKDEDQFDFPDGGWVCNDCQNYNFYGRPKCNRCQKQKTRQDFNGKPRHLLKQTQKILSSNQANVANLENVKPAGRPLYYKNKENCNLASDQTKVSIHTKDNSKFYFEEKVGDWVCFTC